MDTVGVLHFQRACISLASAQQGGSSCSSSAAADNDLLHGGASFRMDLA
jgi:hypothetical protein